MSTKYGITEKKKAELDNLTEQVTDAQLEVQRKTALVDSYDKKLKRFNELLAQAEKESQTANNNKDEFKKILQQAKDLNTQTGTALDEINQAETTTSKLAEKINEVIQKLIYAVEIINRLGNLIARKKDKNSLVSDELVTLTGTAGEKANNAVALTLTALKSVFEAQAGIKETGCVAQVGNNQTDHLLKILKGPNSMATLINEEVIRTDQQQHNAQTASNETLNQLNFTKSQLQKAQVRLDSLKAGLAAAKAAAFAS